MTLEVAASVAGLIGLVGLFVQSATTLYTFCHNIPRVAAEVGGLVQEVERLNNVLSLLHPMILNATSHSLSPRVVKQLEEEIGTCTENLATWLGSMKGVEEAEKISIRSCIKKLKLAADSNRFSDMRIRLSSHRGQLGILLELLGV
jgi:hypothetical protein